MRIGRPAAALAALLLAVMLAACVPTAPERSAPISLQRTGDGSIVVRVFPCGNPDLLRFDLSYADEPVWRPENPEIWRVRFRPGTAPQELTLGVVPPDATEVVEFPAGGLESIDRDYFAAEAWYEDGGVEWNGFDPEVLDSGLIHFDSDEYTADEFADVDPCTGD